MDAQPISAESFPAAATVNYVTPPAQRPRPWPRSVTWIAMIGVFYGALGIGLVPLSHWAVLNDYRLEHPLVREIRSDDTVNEWFFLLTVPAMVSMLLLFVGSIGALFRKPWGRRYMLYFAWMEVVLALCSAWQIRHAVNNLHRGNMVNVMPAFVALKYGAVYLLLSLLFPLLLLHYLTRPNVRAAFAGPRRVRASAAGTGFEPHNVGGSAESTPGRMPSPPPPAPPAAEPVA